MFVHIKIKRLSRAGFAFLGVDTSLELEQESTSRWLPLPLCPGPALPCVCLWSTPCKGSPRSHLKALVSHPLTQSYCPSPQGLEVAHPAQTIWSGGGCEAPWPSHAPGDLILAPLSVGWRCGSCLWGTTRQDEKVHFFDALSPSESK